MNARHETAHACTALRFMMSWGACENGEMISAFRDYRESSSVSDLVERRKERDAAGLVIRLALIQKRRFGRGLGFQPYTLKPAYGGVRG